MNLRAEDLRWQTGATRWSRIRRVVITDDEEQQPSATRRDTVVVTTPLELVFALEDRHKMISTVVLAGRFALDHALVSFLGENYPQVNIDWLGEEAN